MFDLQYMKCVLKILLKHNFFPRISMRFLANPHPLLQSHNFCQEDYYEQMPSIQPFPGLQIKLLLTPMNQKYGKGFKIIIENSL